MIDLPNDMLGAALAAAQAAPAGSKEAAFLQSIQGAIGTPYLRQLYRDGVKVWEATCTGLLPVSGNTMTLPTTGVTQSLISAANISSGSWSHVVRHSTDASKFFSSAVTASSGPGPFFLSGNLTNSVPLTLSSINLTSPAFSPPPSGKRWFPGHYMQCTDAEGRSGIAQSKRALVASNPNFAGYQVSIWWGQTETTQGNYAGLYSQLDTIRAAARADNKKIWLRLYERSFAGESRPAPFPQYIRDTGEWYNLAMAQAAGYTGTENLYTPRIWKPGFVRERFLQWCERAAEYVAANPEFVLISNEEWSFAGAWRFGLQNPVEWNAADNDSLWQDFATRVLARCGDALLHCNSGWHSVGGESVSYYKARLDTLLTTGVQVLGPTDLRKDGSYAFLVTDFGRFITNAPSANPPGYRGQRAFCAQYEWPNYSSLESPAEHLRWGVDDLGLHFIAWDPDPPQSGPFAQRWWWGDALSAVNAANGRINTARPSIIP